MSTDFAMAMTPELPDSHPEFIGPLARKLSKSSVVSRSEDQSIPSPPMSPYHVPSSTSSSSSSALVNSTPRLMSDLLKDIQIKKSESHLNSSGVNTIITLSNNKTEIKEFPLNSFEEFPLVVNAWNNVGSKGFMRSQLRFLQQYTNRSSASRGFRVNKTLPQRRYAPRQLIKHVDNDVASDSEYSSSFEKVRTRRVVRENSSAPPDYDSDFNISTPATTRKSTPSTPVRKRKPATSSPALTQTHIDWESLPDYSPDFSTLPNNSRCLKVEWKGQPMSLANDPLVGKLHPAEVTLASILRLPCNVYLDSKRRLFVEKVARLRKGLPFRRTDAQKSCRIDVNKASRLFASFEKIGWLEDHLFEKYL